MRPDLLSALRWTWSAVREDVREDPALRYVLLLSLLISAFWFWWRSPNFATPDEYGRLLRPMKAAGRFTADPSLSAFAAGATDGISQGATFYLYGIALVPVAILVVLTGNLSEFATFAGIDSRWELWHAAPAWFWTGSLLLSRLVNVAIALATVYAIYRLVAENWGRRAGRFAAGLLAISLAFVASAHEVNEDTATLLLLLLTLLLACRFVRSGDGRLFLWGSFLAGLAVAFKLTAGVAVLVLGVAIILRAARTSRWRATLVRPRLYGLALLIGLVTIYVGIPNVLFGGPDQLFARALQGMEGHSSELFVRDPPMYASAYALLAGVGAPLLAALAIGVAASGRDVLRRRLDAAPLDVLGLFAILVFLSVFLRWSNIREHHYLPVFAVAIALSAPRIARMWDGGRARRLLVVGLLVSTTLFTAVGTVQYAAEPRDEASEWIAANVEPNATHVVFENSVADVGVVHGRPVDHYDFVERVGVSGSVANESAYTDWMVSTPNRAPEYIQVTAAETEYVDEHRPRHGAYPRRAEFVERLVYGDHYGYEVAAEFGQRPTHPSLAVRLVRAGVFPHIEKHEPYVLILRRPPS